MCLLLVVEQRYRSVQEDRWHFQARLHRVRARGRARCPVPLRAARHRPRTERRRLRPEAATLRSVGRPARPDHARDDRADGCPVHGRHSLLLRCPSLRLALSPSCFYDVSMRPLSRVYRTLF